MKRTEKSKSNSQSYFANIEDDYDDISEIKEEDVIDCPQLSDINVTSMAKGKEKCNDSKDKVDTT